MGKYTNLTEEEKTIEARKIYADFWNRNGIPVEVLDAMEE